MKRRPTKRILIRDERGEYRAIGPDFDDDELFILEEYLCTAMGFDLERAPIAKDYIRRSMEFNCAGSEIINGKVRVYHLITNLKEPEIPKEEFFALVDKWFELVAAGAEQIVITNDNGKFSIETEL